MDEFSEGNSNDGGGIMRMMMSRMMQTPPMIADDFGGSHDGTGGIDLPQSIPIAALLAAVGGILEVFATAVLAYPAARMQEGYEWTDKQLKGCLAINIVLQIIASLSGNLFATWFGPVAIVGPIFFAAQLLANLIVFWIVLGLEAFSREMRIGTYVIVVAVVLLIINGPGPQAYGDGVTFADLMNEPYAMIWAWILFISMLISGGVVMIDDLHKRKEWFRLVILLVARASAFSLNLSTGKAVVLPSDDDDGQFWLIVNIIIKVVSGIIYTRAIVVQSTAVQQKVFVPINAALIVFVNAVTGIVIWEDWRVVQSWIGYVCVFFLLALGCGLLLGDLGLLQETAPETFYGARASMLVYEERQKLLENLKGIGNGATSGGTALGGEHHDNDVGDYLDCELDPTNSDCAGAAQEKANTNNNTIHSHKMQSQDPSDDEMKMPTTNSSKEKEFFDTTANNNDNNDASFPTGLIDSRPIPLKRVRSKRKTRFSVAPRRTPQSREAWASVYGRANAAPRLTIVNSGVGQDGAEYTQLRWSNMEQIIRFDMTGSSIGSGLDGDSSHHSRQQKAAARGANNNNNNNKKNNKLAGLQSLDEEEAHSFASEREEEAVEMTFKSNPTTTTTTHDDEERNVTSSSTAPANASNAAVVQEKSNYDNNDGNDNLGNTTADKEALLMASHESTEYDA